MESIHEGLEKNFGCDICGAKFLRKEYLEKHKKTHEFNYASETDAALLYDDVATSNVSVKLPLLLFTYCFPLSSFSSSTGGQHDFLFYSDFAHG